MPNTLAGQPVLTDFATQERNLDRREAMIQAILANAMRPQQGQMVGNYFAAPNAASAVGSLVSTFLGSKALDKNDKERDTLAEAKKADLAAKAEAFTTGADRKRAIAEAITSQYGPLQQMAASEFGRTPEKAAEQWSDPFDEQVGDRKYRVQKNQYGEYKVIGNDKEGQTINVGEGPMKTILPKMYDDVVKATDAAEAARQSQDMLKEMAAVSDSTLVGPQADPMLWLSKFANGMGVEVDATKVASSEIYQSMATQLTQKFIAGNGGNRNLTEKETRELKAAMPQLANSQKARATVSRILWESSNRSIERAVKMQEQFKQAVEKNSIQGYDFGIGGGPRDFTQETVPEGTKERPLQITPDFTPEQYNALPAGTWFVTPEGKTGVKGASQQKGQ